jgi:hypothetical protein
LPISAPDLSSAAAREEYEREYGALFASIPATPPRVLAQRFARLDARLDAGMTDAKSAMLVPSLLSTEEDRALGRWIQRQHAELARMGCAVGLAVAADARVDQATALRTVALALVHMGESIKWELIAGRAGPRDYAALHELARLALERGWLHSPCPLVIDKLPRTATVDALYFRALLLDRFSSGSLSRQQIEVLDAFLWEWMPALTAAQEPTGAVMRADFDSEHGLRYGARGKSKECLYLSLDALETRRLGVIDAFHAGRVVPEQGRAAQIRLEAHVAVLEQLRRTFTGDEARSPREPVEPVEIEAWAGLADVTHVLELDHRAGIAPAEGPPDTAQRDKYDEIYDRPRRFVRLLDASETGWLIEAAEPTASRLVVGELLALRFHAGTACVLACVVRCVRHADAETALIGLERLSHPGLAMRPCALRTEHGLEGTYVYVPGDDASGRQDAFVVPYRLLESSDRFLVRRGAREFALGFNRVRRRGRGWALAGYEMVDASHWDIVVA